MARSASEEAEVEVLDVCRAEDLDHTAQARVSQIDAELESIAHQIKELGRVKRQLLDERDAIYAEQRQAAADAGQEATVDYTKQGFPWSSELLHQARRVFHIENFRMGQEGVCNAAMDHRDVVVVMPTGTWGN